jgi:beta-aspartyl-peptidase (threonine type)
MPRMRNAFGVAVVVLLALGGCKKGDEQEPAKPPSLEQDDATPGKRMPDPIVAGAIAHGGVGSGPERADGCRAAVDAALAVLEKGGAPLDAAVAGVMVMENDPRYNAGTGSRVRLDGKTVQMDAGVMTSDGRFGGVAVIERVKNPILVAQAVRDTPHLLIGGDGATRFARTLGFEDYDPATDERKQQAAKIVEKLRRKDPKLEDAWRGFDWRKHWNFEATLKELGLDEADIGHDTVGVAVRGADGTYAVALSTGGTSITLRGRIGDTPILGAGLYAGPRGAVAATGKGERIIEAAASRTVHDLLRDGKGAQNAADQVVNLIKDKGSIGLIVVDRYNMIAAADRPMAWAARELGSKEWLGPDPKAPGK